jgi:hypothetical protein
MWQWFILLISTISTQAIGQTNLYTDPYGNTTGTIDGERVNVYTDPYEIQQAQLEDHVTIPTLTLMEILQGPWVIVE